MMPPKTKAQHVADAVREMQRKPDAQLLAELVDRLFALYEDSTKDDAERIFDAYFDALEGEL